MNDTVTPAGELATQPVAGRGAALTSEEKKAAKRSYYAAYYQAHKEKHRKNAKAWAERNGERCREIGKRSRERRRSPDTRPRLSRLDLGAQSFDAITREQWVELALHQSVRFWRYVEKTDGCWLWKGGRCPDGYGKFAVTAPRGVTPKQKHFRAHRISYEMVHGAVPDHLVMRHDCDNPLCVNPAHLRTGTQADNIHDCIARGRFVAWGNK